VIAAKLEDVRNHFAGLLGKPNLSQVPRKEWEAFLAKDGPVQPEDWQRMPRLFAELTSVGRCDCEECRKGVR
jgi:hypothetical protein